jgi:hypothetical protein
MSPSRVFRFAGSIIPFLIISLLLSCAGSASLHPGMNFVERPRITETDEQIWFLYYQDIFDANEGKVASPSDKWSIAAHRGYERAKKEWAIKSESKKVNMIPYIVLGMVVIVTIIILIPKHSPKVDLGKW